jgi:hypothetical protein
MPSVDVKLIAVLAATGANMVLGLLWYAPPFLGKTWQKLVGLSDSDMKNADRTVPMIAMLVLAFVESYVLFHFITYTQYFYPTYTNIAAGLITALWVWVGFVVTVMGGNYMFAQRRKKLLAIDSGYQLVALLAAGLIIGLMK